MLRGMTHGSVILDNIVSDLNRAFFNIIFQKKSPQITFFIFYVQSTKGMTKLNNKILQKPLTNTCIRCIYGI